MSYSTGTAVIMNIDLIGQVNAALPARKIDRTQNTARTASAPWLQPLPDSQGPTQVAIAAPLAATAARQFDLSAA